MSERISIAALRRLPERTVREHPAQAEPLRVTVTAWKLLALVEAVEAARAVVDTGALAIDDEFAALADALARFDFDGAA